MSAVIKLANSPGPGLVGVDGVVGDGARGHLEAEGGVVLAVVGRAVDAVAQGAAHGRVGALLVAHAEKPVEDLEEDPEERADEREVGQVAEEVGVQDDARVHGDGEHGGVAAGQALDEVDPGALGHAVAKQGEDDVWEVVELVVEGEVERRKPVADRGDEDDPGVLHGQPELVAHDNLALLRRVFRRLDLLVALHRGHQPEQPVRQEKVGHVARLELHLEPVHRSAIRHRHDPCVEHKKVQALFLLPELLRRLLDRV